MGSIRNLHTVMLVGVMCVLRSAAQICPYSPEYCNCDSSGVGCLDLQEIPKLITGPNVTQVRSAIFVNGNITTISKDSLPPGLEALSFCDHPLTQIMDDAFDASASSLNVLELSNVKFTRLPGALGRLTNLTRLHVDSAYIQEWNETVLQQIGSTVKELELLYVGISGHPGWISNFHVLETLDLSGNNLTTIPEDFFSSFQDTLSVLNLISTGLTAVPQSFSSLKNLASLDLSYNSLNYSEINKLLTLLSVSNLSTLIIRSVGLTQMPNFSNVHGLNKINLASNNLSDITAGSLPPSVTNLILSGNNLSSVPPIVSGLTKLQRLYLSNNHITTITNATLVNLTLLEELYLNNNPIITILPTAFSGLESLTYLNLGYTNLSDIPTALIKLPSPSARLITITMAEIPLLSCPCPISSDLNTWFHNNQAAIIIVGFCSNGQYFNYYFFYGCRTVQPSTTTITTTTTTTITTTTTTTFTTTKGRAPALEFNVVCRYGSLLFLPYLLFVGFY